MNLQEAFLRLSEKLPSDQDIVNRLKRAYDILAKPGYSVLYNPCNDKWKVWKLATSAFEEDKYYTVDESSCTCPDFPTARAGLCKHRLAVRLLEMQKEIE